MKLVIDGIDDVPGGDDGVQRKLRRSISGMRDILVRLPEDRLMEAELVAEQSKVLLETASQSRLNQTMIRLRRPASGCRMPGRCRPPRPDPVPST